MDQLRDFLQAVKARKTAEGRLRGLLHLLVGHTIRTADGTVVSSGMTWRQLAAWLKKLRWPPEAVKELGIEPGELPPRDRDKFWYQAIARAGVASDEARAAAEELVAQLVQLGYQIGPPPVAEGERGPSGP